MAKLKYKTQAVNTVIDPSGGYICRVVNADPVETPTTAAMTRTSLLRQTPSPSKCRLSRSPRSRRGATLPVGWKMVFGWLVSYPLGAFAPLPLSQGESLRSTARRDASPHHGRDPCLRGRVTRDA